LAEHTKIESVKREDSMPGKTITLKEAFGIRPGEVISLVGAGGKTTLMSALARELCDGNESVITTTTTKIFEWQAPGEKLIIEADENKMLELAVQALQQYRHITLASKKMPDVNKLDGISPQMIIKLADLEQVDYIIIEADGAARKPLKAPNATEPVIPSNTSLVIAIVGIDALNKKLDRENVFRPEIVSKLTGLAIREPVTPDAITTLVTHNKGITKGSPSGARIIPVINKMDITKSGAEAEALAYKILEVEHPEIERVVLCQLQSVEPVVDIIQTPRK